MDKLKFDLWMDVLIFLAENHNNNISSVTQGLRASYAHIFNLCSSLQYYELVTLTKSGRTTIIELTNNGWKAASYVKDLKKTFKQEDRLK